MVGLMDWVVKVVTLLKARDNYRSYGVFTLLYA